MLLTTWEASQKHGFTTRHLRHLLELKKIKGRQANINAQRKIWLIEESSLKDYLKKERRPGPKAKKK